MKAGTKIRFMTLVGPTFEPDWSETGRICRMSKYDPLHDKGWHIVRFDRDGAQLCVHESRLMPVNAQ